MRLPSLSKRRKPTKTTAVRAGAVGALVAAVVVPHVRRQLKIPAILTVASTVAAPIAIAVLWPRTRGRDLGLFAGQMWAFAVSHELPYDDPDRLRERLHIDYPIRIDRWIGRGRLPNTRLQALIRGRKAEAPITRISAWAHWFWFIEPYGALFWILVRRNESFPASARQLATVFNIGCVLYFAVPTAPPWWAAENGFLKRNSEGKPGRPENPGVVSTESAEIMLETEEEIHRVMVEFGEKLWGPAWTRIFGTLGSNPWAAMPSLHFATAVMAAILLSDAGGKVEGTIGWSYALALGFALVYLGEHYVTDLLAGLAVVGVARKGEPLARPLVKLLNNRLRRLEAIAAG